MGVGPDRATSTVSKQERAHAVAGRTWSVPAIAGLIAMLLLGLMARWFALGRDSLWMDEGYTWWVMRLDLASMINVLRHDVGSPLLYGVMGGWTKLVGQSELAMRAVHALCGSLALGVFFLLARRLLRRPWAIVGATAWFAIAYLPVIHSREARYYAIMMLVALVALYALCVHLRHPRWIWLAVIAAANLIGLYTQNVMGVYLIALDLAWLLWPGVQPLRRRLLELVIVNVVLGVAFLPWLGVVLDQLRWMNQHFWAEKPDGWALLHVLSMLLGAPWWFTQQLLYDVSLAPLATRERAILLTVGLGGLLLILALGTILGHTRTGRRGAWRYPVGLLVLALFPVGLIYLKSILGKPMFYERLFIASCAPLGLLLAWPLDRMRGGAGLSIAGGGFVALLTAGLLATLGSLRAGPVEDWRAAYNYLAERPIPRRLIVFVTAEAQLPFDYYAHRDPDERLARAVRTGLPGGYFDIDPPQNVRKVTGLDQTRHVCAALRDGAYDEVALVLSHVDYVDPERYGLTTAGACGRWVDNWVSPDRQIEIIRYAPRLEGP